MVRKAVLLLRNRPFYGANIVSLPAIHVARKYARAEHVTVFSSKGFRQFYADVPWVDVCIEQQSLLGVCMRVPSRTDLYYSMRPRMEGAAIIGAIRRARLSLGLCKPYNPFSFFFDGRYGYTKSEYRAVGYLKPLIDRLALPEPAAFYMREAMLELTNGATKPAARVCMMPGAGAGEFKKWGIDKYYALAQALHEDHARLHFDFVLGPGETYERDYLQARKGHGLPFAVHSNLSLAENTALVESSTLVVANDCGPSHIAQCLQRPFIGLYCENDPEWFFPHPHSVALTPDGQADIKTIPLASVLQHAQALLRDTARPSARVRPS